MRTYYLFVINEDVKNIYENNLEVLYNKLKTMKNNDINLNYKWALYEQMCLAFNTDVINNYLNKLQIIQVKNNKYLYRVKTETSLLQLNYSTSVIVTNVNFPHYFNVFYYYNKNIFVCDFKNKDYFWLCNHFNKKRLYEYN